MNKIEFIYKDKIVKINFEKNVIIYNPKNDFIEKLVEVLSGKDNTAFYNLKSISKNQFNVYYADSNYNIENEEKYLQKSILWKRIETILSENEEIDILENNIQDSVGKINQILNKNLSIDAITEQEPINIEEIVKLTYKPQLDYECANEYKYSLLFKYYSNKGKTVIIIDNYDENDISLIYGIFEKSQIYKDIYVIFISKNPNTIWHFKEFCPIIMADLNYLLLNKFLEQHDFQSKIKMNFDSFMLYVLNYIKGNQKEKYLKMQKIDEKDKEIIKNIKKHLSV